MNEPTESNDGTPRIPPGGAAPTRAQDAEPTATLARLLDAYLAELDAGGTPDRAKLLADHPELAASLEEALAGLEFIHQAATREARPPLRLGDFQIVRELGRGGMGVVYEAEQISLKRRVALKVLRFGPAADDVAMQRFRREAETVGRLHHTNIVPIFAIGAEEGVHYYAMQFIDGRDLGQFAQAARTERRPLDFRQVAGWGLQAAEALAHAHQRGVIHRDIKPSNLILDGEGRIWLTDFGLARRLDDVTLSLTGAVVGTPRYMSPEQAAAAKRPIDHRTDIYSLGATLYELVTGRPIFEAESPHEVITQILHREPRAPRQVVPNLPRDLETIVLKCLSKDPARRYASAEALAEDLRAFAAGRPIRARRPPRAERVVRWVRHHRKAVALATVSAAVSAALLAGGFLTREHFRRAGLGELYLQGGRPGLLAEVLDAQGRTVVPLFPLPMEKPVALPAGPYQARVLGPGILSEDGSVEVVARDLVQHPVNFNPRWLWPPQEPAANAYEEAETLRLRDTASLLLLIQPTRGDGQAPAPSRLRLVAGASAQAAWTNDLVFDDSTVPPGGNPAEWRQFLARFGVAPNFAGTGIARRARDLDGDQVGDIVLLSRSSPSLLAISGATGRPLWWHRGRPALSSAPAESTGRPDRPGRGWVVGQPTAEDVDGDGTADLIACFWSETETYTNAAGTRTETGAQGWIAAVSGRTGTELWRQRVEGPWEGYNSGSVEFRRLDPLCRPVVARSGNRPWVALPDGPILRLWDARTGEPATPAEGTIPGIFRAPEAADLDRDGTDELLVLSQRIEGGLTLELSALTLPALAVRWRTTVLVAPSHIADALTGEGRRPYALVDLAGDGRPGVLLAAGRETGPDGTWVELVLVEGASGELRWKQRLRLERGPSPLFDHDGFVVGPDLDGDQHREVFAAWSDYDPATRKHGVRAAAFSGKTGEPVWRRHHPELGTPSILSWWRPGRDGLPLLLVPTGRANSGRSATCFLAARSGRLEHVLLDTLEARVEDFDGDGGPDLFYTTRTAEGARRSVWPGTPGTVWHHLGEWMAGDDLDQDGWTDFVGLVGRQVAVRSGRDGARLWGAQVDVHNTVNLFFLGQARRETTPAPVPFVLIPVTQERPDAPPERRHYRTLGALASLDGRRLWTAPDTELALGTRGGSTLSWSYQYPYLATPDLDQDGVNEILLAQSADDNTLSASVLSGRDGTLWWSAPIVTGALAAEPDPGGLPVADFNRDGIRDLALILPPGAANGLKSSCAVTVLHGRTGQPLWPAPFALTDVERNLAWPNPALGDLDGDGIPEVALVRHGGFDGSRNAYVCDLIVLDGRSGLVRWTWTWQTGFPELWPPLFLRPDGGTGSLVAIGIREEGFDGMVLLDADGKVHLRRPARPLLNSLRPGTFVWRSLDADGDGTSELLYRDGTDLCLARGPLLDVRWRRTITSESLRLVGPVPLRTAPGNPLVLWAGHDVLGLHTGTGACLWRGPVPLAPAWGGGDGFEIRLLARGAGLARPGLQLVNAQRPHENSSAIDTWPTTPDGRYQLPEGAAPGLSTAAPTPPQPSP